MITDSRDTMNCRMLCVLGLVLFAGCSGLVSPQDGTNNTTEVESVTETHTPTQTERQLSDQEQEYVDSGNRLAGYIEEYLNPHPHVRFLDHRANANNTLDIEVQTDGAIPLEQAVMDSVQASSAAVHYTTREDPPMRENGTLRFFHEPERVRVYLRGPDRQPLGIFAIDGEEADHYRNHNISTNAFAQNVMETYEVYDNFQRGDRHPSWYLNHSELSIWVRSYQNVAQRWARETGGMEATFPVENIQINESRHEILHSAVWDRDIYDVNYLSARAVMLAAYWHAAEESYAMPPERLNYHLVLPENDDVDRAGYMDREQVYTFLQTNRGRPARIDYAESVQTYRFENGTEPPFEGF